MTDERRTSPRHTAYLAAELDTGEGDRSIAITRDVGANGLLVLSRRELVPGQVVKLRVAFAGKDDWYVTGEVVRQEPLAPGESSLWRTKVALRVDAGDPVQRQIFAELDE